MPDNRPLLTKEQIEAADDRRFETLVIPEWGGSVRVRSLTEEEYDDYQDSIYKRRGKNVEVNLKIVRRRLAALSVVDANGAPILSEEFLKKKGAKAVGAIVAVAMRLNGMDDSDLRELAGDDEAKPKNSESAPGEGRS